MWTMRTLLLLTMLVQTSGPHETASQVPETELKFVRDGLQFAATLFLPSNDSGPFPAIAFTHGSAKEHRRLPGYRGLAQALAGEGLAVLLFDKRGVGDSEGDYEETPYMETAAGDLLAAVDLLIGHPDIDASRVGVFGHSQGAWIAPLAASMDRRVAFVVAISGGGVQILEQVIFQQHQELLGGGKSGEDAAKAAEIARIVFPYYATGEGLDAAKAALTLARREPWADLLENFWIYKALPSPEQLQTPTFEFFRRAKYDPAPNLERVQVPSLLILGAQDVQTPAIPTVRGWMEGFRGKRARLLTVHMFGHEGHALWKMADGEPKMRRSFWEPLKTWLEHEVFSP